MKDAWGIQGSRIRDRWRFLHKQRLGKGNWYASDGDFFLISFKPPGVIALLDLKGPGDDSLTDTEQILIRWAERHGIDFYLVDILDVEAGRMRICVGLNAYFVASVRDWDEYAKWERGIRAEWSRLHLESAEVVLPMATSDGGY